MPLLHVHDKLSSGTHQNNSGGCDARFQESSAQPYREPSDESSRYGVAFGVLIKRLAQADCVLVVGYSLPEADEQARSAMMLAFQHNRQAKWVVVNSNTEVCARYERILGTVRSATYPMDLISFSEDLDDNMRREFLALSDDN